MKLRRQRMGRGAYSPTAGLHFDDEEFESRIVWVWSTARSGSTWLLRLLSHPLKLVDSRHDVDDLLGFVAPRTWQGKVDVIPVDTTFIANHLLPLQGSADYSDDLSPRTFSSALGLRERANYFFSSKYADAWRPEVRRMMLVRYHRLLERTAERYDTDDPLLVLKEVAGAHAAPLVMSLFSRSKMIFLVRDGRDVVDSQTAANQPEGWLPVTGWSTPEERLEFIRRRSRTWVGDVTSIEKAFRAHPAELRRKVRYEDLLEAPIDNLRALIAFMGIRKSERWIERAVEVNAFDSIASEQKGPTKFFRSATPGAWRKNMTEEEAAILDEVMADKLREVGYSVTDGSRGDDGRSNGESAPHPAAGNIVSTAVNKQGEGRDYTNLVRLINRRGGPVSRRERKVALTFDDGPVLQTHQVLETLARYGVRGTFFLVGRKMDGHEKLVLRLLREGHEIGNHSYGHAPFPSADDVAACTAVIEHVTGRRPELFRPPFGAVDTPGAETAIQEGMRVTLWSVDSRDALPPWRGISPEEVTRNVLENASPGAIVLLHDGLPWSRAADALPALIEGLLEKGYRLVTVSELLADPHRPPATRTGKIMRRLRHVLGDKTERGPAASEAIGALGARGSDGGDTADRGAILELLRELADEVEIAPDADEPAKELIRGAREGLFDLATESGLLTRHTVAYERNAALVIALGFSLRRFESGSGPVAALPDELAARLRDAADPGDECRLIAEELAEPRRHKRLMAARLAKQGALSAPGAGQVLADAPGVAAAPVDGASADFQSMFAPGAETWKQIDSWARETCQRIARQRMRRLLDAAGVNVDFDVEPLVERLDVDFLFRFGYALATCGEEHSRADS